MLYRSHSRPDRPFHAFCAMCVCGYFESIISCCFNDSPYLFLSKLGSTAIPGLAEYATGGSYFNKVNAVFIPLPYSLPAFIGAINYAIDGAGITAEFSFQSIGGISMATCC